MTSQRPIGFWLKLVDTLLDERLADTLGDQGLSRRDWQVLNVVRAGANDMAAIAYQLRPFLGTGDADATSAVDRLRRRGWLIIDAAGVRLAPDREAAFASLARLVGSARRAAVAGVEPAEYVAALSVLERIAHNLGWEDASLSDAAPE